MRFKNCILFFILFISISYVNGQTTKTTFKNYVLTSYYQIDKTPSGNVKKDSRKVTIYIKDPMAVPILMKDQLGK